MEIFWIIPSAILLFGLILGLSIASFSAEQFLDDYNKLRYVSSGLLLSVTEYITEISKKIGVNIKVYRSERGDYYSCGAIYLSKDVLTNFSLASLAIISHELGHAKQDVENQLSKLHKLRNSVRVLGVFFPIFIVVSVVFFVLVFLGVLQSLFLYIGIGLSAASFLLFCVALYKKLCEIKIEKQASNYALEFMEPYTTKQELKQCKQLLDSARLTYWADFFRAILGFTFLTKKTKLFG